MKTRRARVVACADRGTVFGRHNTELGTEVTVFRCIWDIDRPSDGTVLLLVNSEGSLDQSGEYFLDAELEFLD